MGSAVAEGSAIGRDEVVEALADAPVAVGVGVEVIVEVSDVVGTEEREPVDEVEVGVTFALTNGDDVADQLAHSSQREDAGGQLDRAGDDV